MRWLDGIMDSMDVSLSELRAPGDHPLALLPSLQMLMWSLGDRAVLLVCGLGFGI